MQWGLGQMGMTIDEFFDISFRQFFNKLQGFSDWHDMRSREAWERARLHAVTMVQSWSGKSISPEALWQLKWDEPEEEPTSEGLEEFKKKFGSTIKK